MLLVASTISYAQDETVESPKVDLHTAVILNDISSIKQHIAIGSDLNVVEPTRKSTPLITAAVLGKTEAAIALIKARADLDYKNADGSTALHTASFLCHPEIVKSLLENGADKSLLNNSNKTALEIAETPFEEAKPYYDAIGAALQPLGVKLDYERIKTTKPAIAEMLK